MMRSRNRKAMSATARCARLFRREIQAATARATTRQRPRGENVADSIVRNGRAGTSIHSIWSETKKPRRGRESRFLGIRTVSTNSLRDQTDAVKNTSRTVTAKESANAARQRILGARWNSSFILSSTLDGRPDAIHRSDGKTCTMMEKPVQKPIEVNVAGWTKGCQATVAAFLNMMEIKHMPEEEPVRTETRQNIAALGF